MADAVSDGVGKKERRGSSNKRTGVGGANLRGPAARQSAADQPFLDTTAYGSGPDDSITDAGENAAITHHVATINGIEIPYTATAGHLVAVDPSSSRPAAKFFYVAFTADGIDPATRPVTFFYNGGPGSSSVFLLLGSFAPRRIRTSMPGFTPPPPYAMEDNPDSLIDRSDLAATMAANPDLLVLSANGWFDSVTPFFQTRLTLDAMPLVDAGARANLTVRNYPSGHMIYLDAGSRTAMKADLAVMYDRAVGKRRARLAERAALSHKVPHIVRPYFKLPGIGDVAFRPAVAGAKPWKVQDLCEAYSWPNGLAGGGVIAIIEFSGGWVQKDIDAYFRSTGLPAPAVVDVPVGSGRNEPNRHPGDPAADPDREVALDIEVAAAAYAVATGNAASVRVYWADAADWGAMATAIIAAAADGCDVCSISWGSDEANWKAAAAAAGIDYPARLNMAAQAAAKAGMIVFAASGDNDSSDGGPDPANVDLPSSSPFVVGCGGTMKPHGADAVETVWNDDPGNPQGSGTGGGFSELFRPMPAWQAGAPHGPGRMVPDVAANADPYTGYEVFVHGAQEAIGGTSAVAPLYAGLFAAFGRKLGLITPRLWLNHTCFNDITKGDNGYFRARIGPDPCTGIGTPIADKLSALFQAPGRASAGKGKTRPAAKTSRDRQRSNDRP
ncbi:S8 family serine peptidase [Mesorhizobium sp. SP-1A]|uniref:S8 family serine peptidase n=1 Tax=Mesorhizobium sp. SP-1A TaxID=3077840 RepID=UPI0028F706C3|nr:S8 family serine peptidase [Mesorhizobium sp. SP-1A]